jgi:hypothetical protein
MAPHDAQTRFSTHVFALRWTNGSVKRDAGGRIQLPRTLFVEEQSDFNADSLNTPLLLSITITCGYLKPLTHFHDALVPEARHVQKLHKTSHVTAGLGLGTQEGKSYRSICATKFGALRAAA